MSQKAYLCIAEQGAGVIMKQNKWKSVTLDVDGMKYILKKNKKSEWKWSEFGDKLLLPGVSNCFDEFNNVGYMRCTYG